MSQALIIDDNASNALVLQQLLMLEDVVSISINNTKNLTQQLDLITGIDVVFLDLEMPATNGYDALHLIKSHANFASVPVVAYSVHISEIEAALDAGFDGFLGKPISAEEFPYQLQRILRGEMVRYIP